MKKYSNYSVKGTGDGRVTKDDAVNATPSMGTPTGGSRASSNKTFNVTT
jgi:2-oxoglutarate dehydrogenase E2 component (dihydrolipoamide succinyltransferase)